MVTKTKTLGVWMNGLHIGVLSKDSAGALSFSYSTDWLETPGARPISLSMPLRHKAYHEDVVYNYFDNLLPDNRQIRDRIQARFRATTSHPFDLLASIGMDCVGAIQLVPEGVSLQDVRRIEGKPLDDSQISKLLSNYRTAPLGMTENEEEAFRISIAGAQEKTALLWHENVWHRPLGATPTTHIFKLPIGKIEHSGMDLSESCENEWLCLALAEAFELPVCHSEVRSFDGTKALIVERFDRRFDENWIMRLPQEDLCQALGYSSNIKYESDSGPGINKVMKFLLQSRESRQDREVFFKSQVLFWLLAALDGHAKNFSVFIEPEGRFKLTPLYDIMSAFPLMVKKELQEKKIKMAMALAGKNRHYLWHSIQPRHFVSTARNAGFNIEEAKKLFNEMIDRIDEAIAKVHSHIPANFPDHIVTSIFEGVIRQKERRVDI